MKKIPIRNTGKTNIPNAVVMEVYESTCPYCGHMNTTYKKKDSFHDKHIKCTRCHQVAEVINR